MYATEQELDEAREKMVEYFGYDLHIGLEFSLRRQKFDDGTIEYFREWSASCRQPFKQCECCGKNEEKYYLADFQETPMEAVESLKILVEKGEYV